MRFYDIIVNNLKIYYNIFLWVLSIKIIAVKKILLIFDIFSNLMQNPVRYIIFHLKKSFIFLILSTPIALGNFF